MLMRLFHRRMCCLIPTVLLLAVTGCSKEKESKSTTPADTAKSAKSEAEPTAGRESLRTYVREALERNPSIQAAVANVEATLEKIPRVTSLPDPFLRTIVSPCRFRNRSEASWKNGWFRPDGPRCLASQSCIDTDCLDNRGGCSREAGLASILPEPPGRNGSINLWTTS